jgi:phenylacetate-CoA oxygenase PaaH subunit
VSKVRENIPIQTGELESAPTGDMQHYEIFIQLERGKPHTHAGSLEAVDEDMALQFARDHYGRDQPCVQVWVVPRAAISCLDAEKEVIWRLTDQSYRQAKGYAGVRKKWEQFRKSGDVDRYQTEDLKEGF